MSRGYLHSTPTFIDGLYLAVNAVPGTHLIVDCPGCGTEKPGKTGLVHDLTSTLLRWDHAHRAHYSDLHAADMVMGSEVKLEAKVRAVIREHAPDLILLTQSSAVLLMGTDVDGVARALEAELGVRLRVVASRTLSGDYSRGFADALNALAAGLELDRGRRQSGVVGVIGYPMDRAEEDHQANLRELGRMLEALGLELAPVLPSGAPMAELEQLACAERLLAFPGGISAAERLAGALEVEVVRCALPVGLGGTTDWLRVVGDAFGRREQAERFIVAELGQLVPRLESPVRRTFANRRVAVAAGPDLAPGLISWLDEFGLSIASVVLKSRVAEEAEAAREALRATGQHAPVVTDPTFLGVEEHWRELQGSAGLDLVVGSGNERDAGKALGLPFLELGYPCFVRHALFDAPWLGYRGAAWLADALFNLLSESDYRAY